MCGRYSLFTDADSAAIRRILRELIAQKLDFRTGEVFPTDPAPVLLEEENAIQITPLRWGYPSPTGKGSLINARAETAAEKRLFCSDLFQRRCVIPTTGFYEWSHAGPKSKYLFRLPNSPVLFLAGFWGNFDGERRFIVLTTEANASMRPVHGRMPVILREIETEDWIRDGGLAEEYLRRVPPELAKTKV